MSEGSIFRTQLIERVMEGMTVIDANGEKLGKVEYVKMSDPEAATTEGNEPGFREGHGLTSQEGGVRPGVVFTPAGGQAGVTGVGGQVGFAGLAPVNVEADAQSEERLNVFDDPEPDVPEPLRTRLVRKGFIKIDGPGPGFLDTDRYVSADRIASVDNDTVVLNVAKGQTIAEDDD